MNIGNTYLNLYATGSFLGNFLFDLLLFKSIQQKSFHDGFDLSVEAHVNEVTVHVSPQ